jgi:hypothetical protein
VRARVEQIAAVGDEADYQATWEEDTVDCWEIEKNYQQTEVCKEQAESRNAARQ